MAMEKPMPCGACGVAVVLACSMRLVVFASVESYSICRGLYIVIYDSYGIMI